MRVGFQSSERQAGSELHAAGRGRRKLTEVARAGCSNQSTQIGVIQGIERLGTDPQPESLGYRERLRERGVHVYEARSVD